MTAPDGLLRDAGGPHINWTCGCGQANAGWATHCGRCNWTAGGARPASDVVNHCVDCCCARSWSALGVTEYDGKSIPEHITRLRDSEALVRGKIVEQMIKIEWLERMKQNYYDEAVKGWSKCRAAEEEVARLQAAHDHQYAVAGTMLRIAERAEARIAALEGERGALRKVIEAADALRNAADSYWAEKEIADYNKARARLKDNKQTTSRAGWQTCPSCGAASTCGNCNAWRLDPARSKP